MPWHRKHFLTIEELSRAEIDQVLATAGAFRRILDRKVKKVPALRGKTIVNLFLEPSTRTRLSFEVAARRLGAQIVDFSPDAGSSAAKGETELDALRNLDAMGFDAAVVRDGRDGYPRWLCSQLRARVVNAGDGVHEHPTQALLDALTILEAFGREPVPGALDGLKVAICGDLRHGRVGRVEINPPAAGQVQARADAPAAAAIPWLLLRTQPTAEAPQGDFSAVTHVQRINTAGGVAPDRPCTPEQVGQRERVPYRADYLMFSAR